MTEETTISAVHDGKRLTLEPVGDKTPIELPVWEVESIIPAGFRQSWVDGHNDETEIDLCVGAGVGSKWGTFTYARKSDGAQVFLVFDGGALAQLLADYAGGLLEARTEKEAT